MTDFGTIGLGTMGSALLLNMLDHGFSVSGLDTSPEKVEKFLGHCEAGRATGTTDMGEFVRSIRRPRPILVLVPAGPAVDSVLEGLTKHLEPGDFVIDGGNSHFRDTDRRIAHLKSMGEFGFMGMGVSGGEKGARFGPSMMPGGAPADYERVRPILEAIAAKHEGRPCVARVGDGSAGHYVKMVHNGIEYAMMQLISEIYSVLRRCCEKSNDEIADLFSAWNETEVGGYLLEISATVLRYREEDGGHLIDRIKDAAKGKGTGKWTTQDAFDLGVPVPTIDAAVTARYLSALGESRAAIGDIFGEPAPSAEWNPTPEDLRLALRTGFVLAYAQGMQQILAASKEYGYGIDFPAVVSVWRAGCIIRSKLLHQIADAVDSLVETGQIMRDEPFSTFVREGSGPLRRTVSGATSVGFPILCLSTSLGYLDSLRAARLPANLIQGQRDLFGAHTYERIDRPGSFHTEWELATPVAPATEEGRVAAKGHSNE